MKNNNYSFIGMAAAGKTSYGKIFSKKLGYIFLDIDKLIENKEGKKLHEIINFIGEKNFIKLEEKYILGLKNLKNTVISTGGSVVYSEKSMKKLKNISKIIFVNTDAKIIKKRIAMRMSKGKNSIIGLKEKGFENLYNERLSLYKKYADIEVKNLEDLNKLIKASL